jgi:hypothetical protein
MTIHMDQFGNQIDNTGGGYVDPDSGQWIDTSGGQAPQGSTGSKILDTATSLGNFAGDLGAGRAAGRQAAGQANQAQAGVANTLYGTQMGNALKGPTESARSTALGDTMANITPFSYGGTKMVGNIPVVQSSGGLNPSNFGPNTRAAGRNLSSLSLSRVTDPRFNLPTPPVLPGLPQATGLDKGLSAASTVAGLLKAGGGGGGSGGTVNYTDMAKSLINHFGTDHPISGGQNADPNNPETDPSLNPMYGPQPDQQLTPEQQAYLDQINNPQDPTQQGGGGPDGSDGGW